MKFVACSRILFAGLFAILFSNSVGLAADNIGRADRIKNHVTGQLGGKKTRVKRGTSVFQNQRIRTGRDSLAQLRFRDNTRLAINANSSIKLDRAVFSGSKSKKKLVLKAARGAFRFASGNLRKKAYKIITPSSTIGVRGTMFDVYVGRRGETIVTLLQGRIQACNRAGVCKVITDPCNCVRIDRNGRITTARTLTRRILRGASTKRVVPFLHYQRPLLRSLKAPTWVVRRCIDSNEYEGPDTNGGALGVQGVGQSGGSGGGRGGGSGEGDP